MSINESPLSDVRFLTVSETATIMRVSKMTVYRLVHSGELEAIRVGRSFRIPEAAINQFLREAFIGSGTSEDLQGATAPSSYENVIARAQNVHVRIYLAAGNDSGVVESAVLGLLEAFELDIERSNEPVIGSWFHHFWARVKESAPPVEEQLAKLQRAVELQGLDMPQSEVDLNQAEAVSRLLASLDSESDALIQVGSVFLVKVEGKVIVRNLTQIELSYFNRHPALFQDPAKALEILQLGWREEPPSVASGG